MEVAVTELEAHIEILHRQMEALRSSTKKAPPKPEMTAPEGFTYLSDFCHIHHVPYQAAADLFPRAIHGQTIKVQGHLQPMIGPKGRRDFYVQLHTRPDFRTCDDCPHKIPEDRQPV